MSASESDASLGKFLALWTAQAKITTGVCAAIANADYNATGKRVRDPPITMDR